MYRDLQIQRVSLIYQAAESTVSVSDCSIEQSVVSSGGTVIHLEGTASVSLDDVIYKENRVLQKATLISVGGQASMTMRNNTFIRNQGDREFLVVLKDLRYF